MVMAPWRPFRTLVRLGAAGALALTANASPSFAQSYRMEVTSSQSITFTGRAESLREVVEEVCWRADVDLLFYDADDRPFGGTFRDLPLQEFLPRLLARESFLTGHARPYEGAPVRVSWLQVLGDPQVAARRRASGQTGTRRRRDPIDVPPMLLQAAFARDADDANRQAAIAALTERIGSDSTRLEAFLATEAHLIAETLASYGDGTASLLREQQQQHPDSRVRAKLDEIIALLETPP